MRIGLIGYGNVAKELVKLFCEAKERYQIGYILNSRGGVRCLPQNHEFTGELCEHPDWITKLTYWDVKDVEIDVLVELSTTVAADGEPALSYIKDALSRGIAVVTGNKGPVLHAYKELSALAQEHHTYLGIGCTVGGALPSISCAMDGCAGAGIWSMEGVLNGTSNYILEEMSNGHSYETALKAAQEAGIAETDPSADITGLDTAIKMTILANVVWNQSLSLNDCRITGIETITAEELCTAKRQGMRIRLLGKAVWAPNEDHIPAQITVQPTCLDFTHPLYGVSGKNKGICYHTDILGDITISGGASNKRAAAGAILRDIEQLKKRQNP